MAEMPGSHCECDSIRPTVVLYCHRDTAASVRTLEPSVDRHIFSNCARIYSRTSLNSPCHQPNVAAHVRNKKASRQLYALQSTIMTSFIIKAQVTLTVPDSWKKDRECAFCQIIDRAAHAYRVYEDDHVIAFLGEYSCLSGRTERYYNKPRPFTDILPLRPGHTLIIPKIHCSRVSELPQEYAAAIGKAVSRISNALTKGASLLNHHLSTYAVSLTLLEFVAVDNTALNVVCNQEYAQVIPHVRLAFPLLFFTRSHLPAGSLPSNSCPEVQLTTNWLGFRRP